MPYFGRMIVGRVQDGQCRNKTKLRQVTWPFGVARPERLARPVALLVALITFGAGAGTARADRAAIDSVNALGHAYIFANVVEAVGVYRDLVAEARALAYPLGEARALQNLGVSLYLRGRYGEGVEAQLAAIRLLERLGRQEDLAAAYGDLGYQMKRRDLPRAMGFMRRGIAIAERHGFETRLGALYDNYGVLQEMNGAPDSAATYYRRALAIKAARRDSVGIPFSLNNLAGIHLGRGEFAAAESLLTRSDAYRQRRDDAYGQLVNAVQWGDLRLREGDLDAAARRYRQALAMPGASEQPYLRSYCHEQLAGIYEEQRDYRRAFLNQRRFMAYRDSLVNVETNARIAALEIEFETEQKDRLLAENRLAIAARERQVTLLAAALAVLAAVAVGLWRHQALKRRQLRRELELRGQLRQAEYEQRLAGEKLRISRELHDNVGAQLTFLVSSLDNLVHAGAGDVGRLAELGAFGRQTLDELRQTVWAMKHEDEGVDALELRLHELKRQCAAAGQSLDLAIERDGADAPSLSSTQLLNLHRVVQEAVQNAMKHAGAARIVVRLAADRRTLTLQVADDGRGFDTGAVGHVGGLANMRQRCRDAGGEFSLHSDARGTRLVCRIAAD
jgi:signal transduction histidine kinase